MDRHFVQPLHRELRPVGPQSAPTLALFGNVVGEVFLGKEQHLGLLLNVHPTLTLRQEGLLLAVLQPQHLIFLGHRLLVGDYATRVLEELLHKGVRQLLISHLEVLYPFQLILL